MFLYLYYKM